MSNNAITFNFDVFFLVNGVSSFRIECSKLKLIINDVHKIGILANEMAKYQYLVVPKPLNIDAPKLIVKYASLICWNINHKNNTPVTTDSTNAVFLYFFISNIILYAPLNRIMCIVYHAI